MTAESSECPDFEYNSGAIVFSFYPADRDERITITLNFANVINNMETWTLHLYAISLLTNNHTL